ncbi:MAG TPA: hypothetical protein VF881_07840 [Polyangiaceae bacterium]
MSVEATELVLFLENDPSLYRQEQFIFRALARKKDRDTYKRALAPKAFATLTNLAAKKYVREHGSPSDRWNLVFSPIDRRHAALILVNHFEDWYAVDYQSLKRPATRGDES